MFEVAAPEAPEPAIEIGAAVYPSPAYWNSNLPIPEPDTNTLPT